MSDFTIGPFVVPTERLVMVAAVAAAFLSLRWGKQAERRSLEASLWRAMLGGMLSARVMYVLLHLDAFGVEPLRALALWEGGYEWMTGVTVGALVLLARIERNRQHARALVAPAFAALVVWSVGIGIVQWSSRHDPAELPRSASLQDLAGRKVPSSSYLGRPTIVNLWATWCPPCRREMPGLAAAQARRDDINFVFLNQGESAAAIERYMTESGLQLRNIVVDPQRAFNALAGDVLPTTLFFNARGELVDQHIGALSLARLDDYLKAITASPEERR